MKKNAILIGIIVVVGIILVFVFTNRTTTIDTNNDSIEVTQSNDTITVNTSDGSLVAGEDVSVPDGFPSDVYIADGTLISVLKLDQNDGYMLNIEVDSSATAMKTEYTSKLKNDGWSITSSLDLQTGSSIFAEKGDRIVTVTIAVNDGKTVVILNTSTNVE